MNGDNTVGPKPYQKAVVYNTETEGYVRFRYWDLQTKKYEKDKAFLGVRGYTKEERQPLLDELAKVLNDVFRKKNKRYEYHIKIKRKEKKKRTQAGHLTLIEWFDKGFNDIENVAEDKRKTYRETKNKLLTFYKEYPQYDQDLLRDIDEAMINDFIKYTKADGRAGKTINKYLWAIQGITEYAKKLKAIDIIFDTKEFRVDAPKNETEQFPPLTHEEKIAAFDYYRENNPPYYLYLLFIYYTCIRPGELHRLQLSNFYFNRKQVKVPGYSSKNGQSAYVQILSPLYDAITEYGIQNLPKYMYLFGAKCQPSKDQYAGNYASDHWGRMRYKFNLPNDKQMYGLKHTFNIDYVENNKYNIDWEFLRRHNRHATVQQTQDYISELTAYMLDETKSIILNYHNPKK